jgi:hypothetical protein
MDYSTEEINKVSELAGLLTPLSDIAVLMDIDEDILRRDVRDRASEVSKAYYKAKAQTALNLRKQEIELANVGSPLGVQLTAGYMITMDSDEDM